ncbi:MAG: DUF4276 family protein [Chloroflexi bacterium]|nr:DUF4276 family protein [Chloroflexota bacterium]
MHIEFYVEERSAEVVLDCLLPAILGPAISFKIYAHQGKPDLLKQLPSRLRAYRNWIPPDWHVAVLIDRDQQDCLALKAVLEKYATEAGLVTKSAAPAGAKFQVLNRLAIEELEAWFFGDIAAIQAAFPGIPELARKARYRDPDAIRGDTWEALTRELERKGYNPGGKIGVARQISAHMQPALNRSHSFQIFHRGLLELAR